ncbi:EF-hand domain-containing protein [Falsiroseomonas tokyonensis]|uniref:EF-hand domain-containing protein n=1 Tax=Falsiroseomonas tokyonensis TaxID=430521 RepID=A0ABV7BNW3_9PROT|nr:hypothetical protein [Falsiroseomonas tokyonensis]MBU8537224.1 hypothetical protein [Falsiroseomonas tokyonensis]
MMQARSWLGAALLFLALPFAAQAQSETGAGVPEALRGAWFAGECTDPEAMLLVTARAAARVEAEAPSRLFRFRQLRSAAGWTIGTGGGAEAPRLMLRPGGEAGAAGLETAEPEAKLRDDRLPGETELASWRRCPAPPVALAALHGEGAAFLAALEHLEAGCGSGTPGACAAAIVAQADVSGDGVLTVAELARLLRGAAWLAAVEGGATQDAVAISLGAGSLAGILSARLLMESLDYDGDGRISAGELTQDRVGFATAPGTAAGRPLRLDGVAEGAGMLRGLMEGLANWR